MLDSLVISKNPVIKSFKQRNLKIVVSGIYIIVLS